MNARVAFLAALDEFEATIKRSTELADDTAHDHRKEGIARRKKTTELVAQLGVLGGELFSDTSNAAAFREMFTTVRSARAFHQASWPVVSIDRENPAYNVSLREMRKATQAFVHWTRNALSSF